MLGRWLVLKHFYFTKDKKFGHPCTIAFLKIKRLLKKSLRQARPSLVPVLKQERREYQK